MTRRINAAMIELLSEGGLEACTFQNVAARAGIERSTLYRRKVDRWPTIVDAIIDMADQMTATFDTGSFRGDLAKTLTNLVGVLNSPVGPSLMEVAGALQAGAAPGQAERFWESRRQQLAPMFDAAIRRGELRPDVDRDELFAMTILLGRGSAVRTEWGQAELVCAAAAKPCRGDAGLGAGGIVGRRFARDSDRADAHPSIGAEYRNAAWHDHHLRRTVEARCTARSLQHLGG